jgi:hypothetical protein
MMAWPSGSVAAEDLALVVDERRPVHYERQPRRWPRSDDIARVDADLLGRQSCRTVQAAGGA